MEYLNQNCFKKTERSVGHFFFFLFQMSNSRTSSPIAYNGFAFASLATGFGGTTNRKVDREAKRPANEANAHVGRSPGQISSLRSFICESVGAAKKDTGV